ncbi:DUF4044 domain-containing protein [Pediococcus acidilactici]|nr:DUF4044 domain-containing protein [Pediococcus acidilactici]
MQKVIMVFVWIMIILTLGSVLYAPLAQLLGA